MTKKTNPRRLILLDAHAILHRAYHALPDFTAPNGEPTGALYGVVAMLLKIIEELKPTHLVACYDLPDPTYRHLAFAGYKAKRDKTDEALVQQIERSRAIFAVFGIPIYEQAGFEADDILGTIAKQTSQHQDLEVIIASGDMDTMQCVEGTRVKVYTLKKGINDTVLYDEAAVVSRFGFPPTLVPDYKGLRGDTSDNIPGIVGIGEKTATELITQFGSLDNLYKKLATNETLLLEAGIKPRIIKLLREGEEEARFSKMLATIRTDAPLDFTLPTEEWQTAAQPAEIVALFTELGFRTLTSRVKQLFSITTEVTSEASVTPDNAGDLREAEIMLWLLESERTNASLNEIVEFGRTYFGTTDFATTKNRLQEELEKTGILAKVYAEIEKPLIPILTKLSATGITLDTAYLKEQSTASHQELVKLESEIHTYAGVDFNLNSPKQLGEVLFDKLGLKPKNQKRTAGGQRSTKESELEKLQTTHPIIPAILRYRELQKLVSTYIDTLPTLVGKDGKIRTTFSQTGTVTGRVASRDPNLQNIPIRTEEGRAIRRAFVAEPGFTLVSIDYSQIELRIAAILSEDHKLIDIFRRGEDVHTGVAVRVFCVDANAVTSEMRRKAKIINFGILYGMGVNALRQNLGAETSREEAQSFYTAYFQTFTRLAEYLEETKQYARQHGYTETLFGRRRHFPGIRSNAPFIRAQAERMAINAPIQGTAADVMRVAMIEVNHYLDKTKKHDAVRMLLQVHDELLFEIKTTALAEVVPELKLCLEQVLVDKDTHGVPLEVKVLTGPNWADLSGYQA